MDFDNDGKLDMISGSYDPGDVYLFKGLGPGKFAKGAPILDENNLPLVHHPEELARYQNYLAEKKDKKVNDSDQAVQWRVASFGSWATTVDWDHDQDLDILIGSFGGKIYLRENIGSRSKPVYSGKSQPVLASESPIKETCHAAPVVADWDQDGKWDLIVGSGDGSVGWYRNVGSLTSPKFGSRKLLVNAPRDLMSSKFVEQNLKANQDPIPGARAQIHVVDYDRDGRLDLLVGDYSDINWTKELSEEETKAFEAIKERIKETGKKLSQKQSELYGEAGKKLDAETKEKLTLEYQKIVQRYTRLDEKRRKFYSESRSASFIWLYRRKSASGSPAGGGSSGSKPKPSTESEAENQGRVQFGASLHATKNKNETALIVDFRIKDGWHMYAKDSKTGGQAVRVDLQLPDGVKRTGEWIRPLGIPSSKNRSDWILEGFGHFEQKLKVEEGATGTLQVKITYQVCDEKMCLPPETLTKTLRLK